MIEARPGQRRRPVQLDTFPGHSSASATSAIEIYKKKFFIKFLNNFIAQLDPVFFYSIGGYLVLRAT